MTKILSNKSNIDLDYPICRSSLDLDFTQEVLDPRITFSRGSTGTRVNRNRLIETVSANQPRFDYDPVTGECKGLLIEESRTNLVNDNATNFNYSINNQIRATQLDVAPDGTTVLCKHDLTGANTPFLNCRANTPLSPGTYTMSMYLKGTTSYSASFAFVGETTNEIYANTANITTDWKRFTLTFTLINTQTSSRLQLFFAAEGQGRVISIWGAQLEVGVNGASAPFLTSYIPRSSGQQATRSADNADMTGTNFSSWYNQTEGTLYASLNNITTRTSITFDRFVALVGTDVHRNVISICTQTASGGGAQNKFNAGVSYSPDGSYVLDTFTGFVSGGGPDRIGKAILSYKKDNFAFTVNGITPLRDISGDIPVCNRLLIFGSARFQPAPSGTISRLTYYPRALKPNQLQYLTQ